MERISFQDGWYYRWLREEREIQVTILHDAMLCEKEE